MLKPMQYWILCAIASLSIVLVAVDVWLYFSNQSLQARVGARAQYIQNSGPIGTVYQETARTLANLALERHDEDVKALLAKEGFTFNPAPADPAETHVGSKP